MPPSHAPRRLLCRLLWSGLSFLLAGARSEAQTPESPHFHIEQLATGVFAAIAVPGQRAVCNAGIIDMGTYTVVIDPFQSLEAAADLRRAAEQRTGHTVRYVINTHAHDDHTGGNAAFRETAEIVSTTTTLGEMASAGTDSAARPVLPTIVFDTRMTLRGEARTVDLLVFERGHSVSDLVVFLPAEKIVFAGDLLFVECHPWLADGSPERLLQSLQRLRTMEINLAVPGHGPVGDADNFTLLIRYVQDLRALAQDARRRGLTEKDLATIAVPEAYAAWDARWFFLPNLRFLYGRATTGRNP